LCYPRVVSPNKSTFDIQLDECRAEWRRRHPPTEQSGRDVELVRHRELGMAGTLRSQLTFLFFPFLCGPTGRTRCRVVEGGAGPARLRTKFYFTGNLPSISR
jgi:hypothetical protein